MDIYIHFSHSRIAIPPQQWIDLCHSFGVKCLGTFIIEGAIITGNSEGDQLTEVVLNGGVQDGN